MLGSASGAGILAGRRSARSAERRRGHKAAAGRRKEGISRRNPAMVAQVRNRCEYSRRRTSRGKNNSTHYGANS